MDRPEAVTKIKVYSNQPKVVLYNNGKLVAEKTGEHVFIFEVCLEEENHIKAVAGIFEDSALLRKVNEPNPSYKLSGKSSNSANWI